MKEKMTNENLVKNSNQTHTKTHTKLEEEVYNYVVNEVYEGNKDELFSEIVNDRGFGGSPWYDNVPDWVWKMNLQFDYLIDVDYNDLSMKLWDLETQPYFEDISSTDYPQYYDGFNKPREEWSEEEFETSWEYHLDSENHNEIYIGYISFLNTYVEQYLLKKHHKRLKEILKTFIPKEKIEDEYYGYYETTEGNDDVYDYYLETNNFSFRIIVSSGSEGDLDIDIELNEIQDGWEGDNIYNFCTDSLDKLERELDNIVNIYKKVVMDKETEKLEL